MAVSKLNTRTKKADISPLLYGKMPPQASDLEGAVLGAIMLDPYKLEDVLEIIQSPECFYSDANQRIYASIRRLFEKGARIDFMTVCEDLRQNSELEMCGGSYYVTGLTRDVVSSANIEEHARIVVQKYLSRELIRMSGEVIGEAYEDSTDVFDLLDNAGTNIEELSLKQIKKDYKHISSGAIKVLTEVLELQEKDDSLSGIPTGFTELDKATGGWQKTDLIILAARPAVGKTAFALNLVMNAVLDQNKPTGVAFFSLEMSESQLIKRMAANYSDVHLSKISKGHMNPDEVQKFQDGMIRIRSMEIYIDDSANITSTELRIKVKKAKRKHNIGLVIIDYLQLMKGAANSYNRENEISKISRDLKGLAKELEIPIIALSQLNRESDGKTNSEPRLSQLRESGAIEQDADVVMFLYKPQDSQGETCLSIAKHRNGTTEKFGTMFDGGKQRFSQMMNMGEFKHAVAENSKPTFSQEATIIKANQQDLFEDDDPF